MKSFYRRCFSEALLIIKSPQKRVYYSQLNERTQPVGLCSADVTFDPLFPLQVRLRPAHLQGLRRVPGWVTVTAVHAGHRHRCLPAAAPHRRQRRELPSVERQRKPPRKPPAAGAGKASLDLRVLHQEMLHTHFLFCFFVFFFFCLRQFISYVSSKVDCSIDNMCVVCFVFFLPPCGMLLKGHTNFECFGRRDKRCMRV